MTVSAQLDLLEAIQERNDVLETVESGADATDRAVVRQAILAVAERGQPFSANAVRPLLPVLRSNNLVGAIFRSLAVEGHIRRVKGVYEPSLSESTHGHPVAVWIAA